MSSTVLQARRELGFEDSLSSRNGWYHSMEFADGSRIDGYIALPILRERYADLGLPDDLTGMRALDIGALRDGWFSFEMESHGAEVTAVDVVAVSNFQHAHARHRSKVRYLVEDIYHLPRQCGRGCSTTRCSWGFCTMSGIRCWRSTLSALIPARWQL